MPWVIVEPRRTARGDLAAGREESDGVVGVHPVLPPCAVRRLRGSAGGTGRLQRAQHAADPWTLRRGRQNLLWAYLCGLVFLIFPAVALVADQPSRTLLILQGTALAAIAVAYVLTPWIADTALPTRWAYIAGFVGLLAATGLVWGWSAANYGVYVAVMIAALIPWRQARLAIAACGVLLVIMALLLGQWIPAYIALIAVGGALALGAGLEAGRVGAKLSRAEQRVSTLAVAAERERISRDLHDILGHSLTAISIKSELAGRLMSSDPPGAQAQMAEVEGIARQALADVRATASGIREVRVATELASARSVLLGRGRRGPGAVGRATVARGRQRAVRLRDPGGGDQRGPAQRGQPVHHRCR